ncbi:MAG: type II toxin-antitoxin system Phd/YefM family antitoxin [Chloroflexi bacterium]|nr:MAG: type II toxin-antitoxin system Phd/YefM family antitoxin [Chloroflexota bacterium]
MHMSIAETHNRLSQLIKKLDTGPITITKRGKPVGILMAPDEYAQLQRVQAYLQLLRLSKTLQQSGVTARELYESSRQELEDAS